MKVSPEEKFNTKKPLKFQRLKCEITGAATSVISSHTKGMTDPKKDSTSHLNLRQTSAFGIKIESITGGASVLTLLDTFINATPFSQAATLILIVLLFWHKRE